jgi:hypothetical protein
MMGAASNRHQGHTPAPGEDGDRKEWLNMDMRRARSWIAVASVCIAGGLTAVTLTAAPAFAASVSGTEVVEDTLSVPVGATASKTVSCPSGKTVTSGGWTHLFGAFDPDLLIRESRPVPGTGWRVTARNLTGTPWNLGVFAICSAGQSRIYPSTTFTVPPGSMVSGTASCPSGVSVGGGFSMDWIAPEHAANRSRPSGSTGWTVRVSNDTASVTRTVTVWAVCGDFSGRRLETQTLVVAPGTTTVFKSGCNSGEVPAGGGFAHDAGNGHLQSLVFGIFTRSGAFSWLMPYSVPIGEPSRQATLYNVCVSGN